MSSEDDFGEIADVIPGLERINGQGNLPDKRRRLIKACDACRRKKIRCNSHERPATLKCTHCETHGVECTFLGGIPGNRGPPKGYTEELEKRCARLEAIIRRVAPHIDINVEAGPALSRNTWMKRSRASLESYFPVATKGDDTALLHYAAGPRRPSSPIPDSPPIKNCFMLSHTGLPIEQAVAPSHGTPYLTGLAEPSSDGEPNSPDSGIFTREIEDDMKNLQISGSFPQRFHGKSSGVSYVQEALKMKDDKIEKDNRLLTCQFPRRVRFWRANPWERIPDAPVPLAALRFPPEALATVLINACFDECLLAFPVLHRPTFEKNRKAKLHKVDIRFARIYLLACAVGSRFSSEVRTCYRTPSGEVLWNSTGWVYYEQVASFKKSLSEPASLSELQCCVLSALFLAGDSSPHASWLTCGFGIRQCLDIGVHREKVYSKDPERAFDNQMWRRVFWSLVAIDRWMSTSLGRPLSVVDEDIDAKLPLEVDDEYYNGQAHEWKQPEGKPSRVAGLVQLLKLLAIPSHALRTVYAINKPELIPGYNGTDWESHILAELDSALNSWLDSVPEHLRWHPHIENPTHSKQAVFLRLVYHFVQITVHRPFIPTVSGTKSTLSLPSLAICTNAARAASHVLEACVNKGYECNPSMHIAAFSSGITLLIGIWSAAKNNITTDLTQQTAALLRCMRALQQWEKKWHVAGKFRDILTELAALNEVPIDLTPSEPEVGLKRRRDVDDVDLPASATSVDAPPPQPAPPASLFDPAYQSMSSINPPIGMDSAYPELPFPVFVNQSSDFGWLDFPTLKEILDDPNPLRYSMQPGAFTPSENPYNGIEVAMPGRHEATESTTISNGFTGPTTATSPSLFHMGVETPFGPSSSFSALPTGSRPNDAMRPDDDLAWFNNILMTDPFSGPFPHYPPTGPS